MVYFRSVITLLAVASVVRGQPLTQGELGFGGASRTPSPRVNLPPSSRNQFVILAKNSPIQTTLYGLDETSPWYMTTNTLPVHGTLSGFNTNTGLIIYSPTTNYLGTDSYQYVVHETDGSLTSTSTVTMYVLNTPITTNACFEQCISVSSSTENDVYVGNSLGGGIIRTNINGSDFLIVFGSTGLGAGYGSFGPTTNTVCFTANSVDTIFRTNVQASCAFDYKNTLFSAVSNTFTFYTTNSGGGDGNALGVAFEFCNSCGCTNLHFDGVVSYKLTQFANNCFIGYSYSNCMFFNIPFADFSSGGNKNVNNLPISFDIAIAPNIVYTNTILWITCYGTPLAGDNHFQGTLTLTPH